MQQVDRGGWEQGREVSQSALTRHDYQTGSGPLVLWLVATSWSVDAGEDSEARDTWRLCGDERAARALLRSHCTALTPPPASKPEAVVRRCDNCGTGARRLFERTESSGPAGHVGACCADDDDVCCPSPDPFHTWVRGW
ncbi:hypothetical protein [Kitasatospora sp. NPDC002965]|uniref:hypothetical protein n=1 Tax=Kitasatospora sp. NPDC002965 TaxID=3154775 RepID=UPI0033B5FAAC